MRKLISILFLSTVSISSSITTAQAEPNCTTKVCIDVYTQNGQLIIEGKKNGATATPTPRIATTVAPKPKPTSTRKYTYKPRTTTPKPRNTANSLNDKILQSLPTLQIAYQPQSRVLPKLPVIFWTDIPTQFNKNYRILGQTVRVDLSPASVWSFGDGSILVTDKVGKPYPSTEISHSYSVPGTYTVLVNTIWSGSFVVDGVVFPIAGSIKQTSAVDVKVVGAGTKFVGK
jgi:hypothetical protein